MNATSISAWFRNKNILERLWLLAKIEFKLRYYENRLGLFWALLKPIMDILIYYVVFKVIMKNDVPAFASFLFIGLILWNFFVESTVGTIQLLYTKKYLYEYSNMNKFEIYVSTLLSNSIGFFFNLTMFFFFYLVIEKESNGITIQAFYIIPLFINLFFLSLGVSLILSNIYIVAKDITQIWQVFVSLFFFLSPILYKLSVFREALPAFDYGNPVAGIIINARRVLMEGRPPEWTLFMWDCCYAFFLFLLGTIFLKKLGVKSAEKL